MVKYPLGIFAISALAALGAALPAFAGCCPSAVSPCACAPVVQQIVFVPPVEILVVNQGPVYSGPGAYVTQRNFVESDERAPYGFPYVGYVPADTHVGGYRKSFSDNVHHHRVSGHPVRYRVIHARPVRVHRKVDPGYK